MHSAGNKSKKFYSYLKAVQSQQAGAGSPHLLDASCNLITDMIFTVNQLQEKESNHVEIWLP